MLRVVVLVDLMRCLKVPKVPIVPSRGNHVFEVQ